MRNSTKMWSLLVAILWSSLVGCNREEQVLDPAPLDIPEMQIEQTPIVLPPVELQYIEPTDERPRDGEDLNMAKFYGERINTCLTYRGVEAEPDWQKALDKSSAEVQQTEYISKKLFDVRGHVEFCCGTLQEFIDTPTTERAKQYIGVTATLDEVRNHVERNTKEYTTTLVQAITLNTFPTEPTFFSRTGSSLGTRAYLVKQFIDYAADQGINPTDLDPRMTTEELGKLFGQGFAEIAAYVQSEHADKWQRRSMLLDVCISDQEKKGAGSLYKYATAEHRLLLKCDERREELLRRKECGDW